MTMERVHLEREAVEVEVEGRRFLLQEMSAADLREYVWRQENAAGRALDRLANQDERSLTEAGERLLEASEELTLWLLRTPADDGPPADRELVSRITQRQRLRLQELVDRLNDTSTLVGNGLSLIQRAAALVKATR